MDFRQKIERFISDGNLLESRSGIVVGVSGGADSVALLRILTDLGYGCRAVHCNFHLRGCESDRDQNFVEELCNRMGVNLTTLHYDTLGHAAANHLSVEMAARELRYADFERLRREWNCQAIAVAHHRDDSVETVLMNLIRGTGIRGLTGIKPVNGRVVRPLLCVTRSDIEAWLHSVGQDYVTDSTNLEDKYLRNRIRLQLLPLLRRLNPDVDNAVAGTSARLMQTYRYYARAIAGEMAGCVEEKAGGTVRISIEGLLGSLSPKTLLYEILSPWGFNDSQVDDIFGSLDGESGRLFQSAKATLVRDRDRLVLCPLPEEDGAELELHLNVRDTGCVTMPDGRMLRLDVLPPGSAVEKRPEVAMLDAGKVAGELVLRRWHRGDSFIPFGMRGRKLLSDFMTDLKMSVLEKKAQMVLCSGEDIVWVVGRRIDNRYRIDTRSSGIIRLEIIEGQSVSLATPAR